MTIGAPGSAAIIEVRDSAGVRRELWLDPYRKPAGVTVGRHETCDVHIAWDVRVSRRHAWLGFVAEKGWLVEDLSSHNGTVVDGAQIDGRHTLRDRSTIVVGGTVLLFRRPSASNTEWAAVGHAEGDAISTAPNWAPVGAIALTDAQRGVLDLLLEPYLRGDLMVAPPGDGEIAAALQISRHTVKSHVRALYAAYGLVSATYEHKRRDLAIRALVHRAMEAPSGEDGAASSGASAREA